MAGARQIDWSTAQMRDGTLTVGLTGANAKRWRARFEQVLALLDTPHSRWREVGLVKGAIEVAGVERGSEPELAHFLESVLQEVNADLDPQERREKEEPADRAPGPDEQMTATFRSFANG